MDQKIKVEIPRDIKGYTGRECPKCEKYFKIKFGTGIQATVPCHCPYCGHIGPHDEFWTKDQIEYAKSVVLNQVTTDFIRGLKKIERRPDPHAVLSIGIKVKGHPTPIYWYSEQDLEEEVKCEGCTLEYTIYGAFGYCPDCGIHNSLQILKINFAVVKKMLDLAESLETDVREKMIENALEDTVSAFDGFGREICKVNAHKATDPVKIPTISFQSISSVRKTIKELFGFDFAQTMSEQDWLNVLVLFQKRHLIAHKMGIIDKSYTDITGNSQSLIGKKVSISTSEVTQLLTYLQTIAENIFRGIA